MVQNYNLCDYVVPLVSKAVVISKNKAFMKLYQILEQIGGKKRCAKDSNS